MVKITIDTQHDSEDALRRVIAFIEEELRHRGIQPLQGSQEPAALGNIFGEDKPATDMFSVFAHEAPSQTTTAKPIMKAEFDTPTASRLLEDVKDTSQTQNLAREVLEKGNTRNIRLEPYE